MSKICDFMDNATYGAEDINKIRLSLLTKGVLMDSANSCKAIMSNGNVKVLQGQALLHDGSRIEIDSEGVEVTPQSGGKNYVYFKRNELNNTIDVACSLTAPSGNDVPIAEYENGVLSDKRQYAMPKASYTPPQSILFEQNIEGTGIVGQWVTIGTLNLNPAYNTLILMGHDIILYDIITRKIIGGCQYCHVTRDGKECIQTYYGSNKYFVINPDLTVSAYATRSGDTIISVSLQGMAFYSGAR